MICLYYSFEMDSYISYDIKGVGNRLNNKRCGDNKTNK